MKLMFCSTISFLDKDSLWINTDILLVRWQAEFLIQRRKCRQTHTECIYQHERHWVFSSGGHRVTAHNSQCSAMYKEVWWSICLESTETTGGTRVEIWSRPSARCHAASVAEPSTEKSHLHNRRLFRLKSKHGVTWMLFPIDKLDY